MQKRKAIIKQYKERQLQGGVYTITNTLNGKYLIGHAANLGSVQNHFAFAIATGSTIHPRLQKAGQTPGEQTFTLEILEKLAQHPGQSQAEFMDDLQALEQLWRAKLDPAKEYR